MTRALVARRAPRLVASAAALALALGPAAGAGSDETDARAFDARVQLVVSGRHASDQTDGGFGLVASWRPARWLAVEAEGAAYPRDLGDTPFSTNRYEALGGVRLGPRLGATGWSVTAKGGVTRFSAAPEPFACILIYPPPLECVLAGGHTAATLTLGAGFEFATGGRTSLRLDAADRMVRYPGPSFSRGGEVHPQAFWTHGLRVAASFGVRF